MTHQLAIERMRTQLQGWKETGDPRGIFLGCYTLMTDNMLESIRQGQFNDNDWVAGLLEHFADYYFNALQAYQQQPQLAPAVWQVAFEATLDPQVHVLQHLMLGINAHINYDLVFALEDVLHDEWEGLTQEQRRNRYDDHCRVNSVIAQTVDAVQDIVVERYAPKLDLLDDVMGRLDEHLVSMIISLFRDRVWQMAVVRLEAQDKIKQDTIHSQVERSALELARSIRHWSLSKGVLHFFDDYVEER